MGPHPAKQGEWPLLSERTPTLGREYQGLRVTEARELLAVGTSLMPHLPSLPPSSGQAHFPGNGDEILSGNDDFLGQEGLCGGFPGLQPGSRSPALGPQAENFLPFPALP